MSTPFSFTNEFLLNSLGYLPARPDHEQVQIATAERENNRQSQLSADPQSRLVNDFTSIFGPR